jgi:hypothetical protein
LTERKTVIDFAAELTSEDEDDPGLDGPDMEEILLSPASQIQLEDSVGPGNNKSHFSQLEKLSYCRHIANMI